ncbi:TetR/AcrR family transcriptional regulator [Ahrensia marina]|uniref:TetR/AcrR family transcriptional regulator n=1 Tax=Ahrensia marina TaxID=1514904 RepID=UPI0035D0174F
MARPTRKKAEVLVSTADTIVETATELFLAQGYSGTSMSALAKASGIQKASLYHHFEGKEAVLFACLQSGYADHVEQMREAAVDNDLSYRQRLKPLLDAVYGAIVESNAGKMAPIVAETTGRFPDIASRFNDEFMAEMQVIFRDYVEGGMRAGEFDAMDPETLDHALFGVAVHLTLCRSMFSGFEIADTKYDIAAVKAHHLTIMRKLLGIEA